MPLQQTLFKMGLAILSQMGIGAASRETHNADASLLQSGSCVGNEIITVPSQIFSSTLNFFDFNEQLLYGWESRNELGPGTAVIKAQGYDLNGDNVTDIFQLGATPPQTQQYLAVTPLAQDGSYWITFADKDRNGNDGFDIFGNKYSADHTPINGTDVLINFLNTTGDQLKSTSAQIRTGEIINAWIDPQEGVLGQWFNKHGQPIGNAFQISGESNVESPYLTALSQGAVVAWKTPFNIRATLLQEPGVTPDNSAVLASSLQIFNAPLVEIFDDSSQRYSLLQLYVTRPNGGNDTMEAVALNSNDLSKIGDSIRLNPNMTTIQPVTAITALPANLPSGVIFAWAARQPDFSYNIQAQIITLQNGTLNSSAPVTVKEGIHGSNLAIVVTPNGHLAVSIREFRTLSSVICNLTEIFPQLPMISPTTSPVVSSSSDISTTSSTHTEITTPIVFFDDASALSPELATFASIIISAGTQSLRLVIPFLLLQHGTSVLAVLQDHMTDANTKITQTIGGFFSQQPKIPHKSSAEEHQQQIEQQHEHTLFAGL